MTVVAHEENFWEPWFVGTDFTTDWSTRAFQDWANLLELPNAQPLNILEIGAWEGRSTIFFLNFFAGSHVTSIDLFTFGNDGYFDRNVMAKYSDRVTKVAARSMPALDRLATSKAEPFDLIYVDGSHDRDDVIMDSVLAWRLLKVGGIMVWDDYGILAAMPEHFNEHQDPKPAIDTFLQWHRDEVSVIHQGYQVFVRKISEHHPVCLDDPSLVSSEARGAEALASSSSRETFANDAESLAFSSRAADNMSNQAAFTIKSSILRPLKKLLRR